MCNALNTMGLHKSENFIYFKALLNAYVVMESELSYICTNGQRDF